MDKLAMDVSLKVELRGKVPIDAEDLISKHPNIAFIVYRKYDLTDSSWAVSFWRRAANATTELEDIAPNESHCPSDDRIELRNSEMIRSIKSFQPLLPKSVAESWFLGNQMQSPYLPLYYYLDEMRQTADPALGADEHQQYLRLLADYCDEHGSFSNADKLISRGIISEDHFSKLFRPGEVILDQEANPPLAYICEELPRPVTGIGNDGKFTLKASRYRYDGKLRLQTETLSCSWSGQAISRISDLPIYPVQHASPELQELLRLRGKTFWMCRKKAYICYEDPESDLSRPGYSANPRFMVDYETYHELHPDADVFKDVTGKEVSPEVTEKDEPPGDGHDLIMPHSVIGFAIQDKKWRSLFVDYISPISWNKSAFEKLVLKPAAKELIQALVTVHMVGKRSSDMIEGKGNGLLILLHGPPGTGKTLTAESVAELVQRPLYRVTCGDIGTDAEGVEAYLESVLHIGKIWGCVVLLDEADVFLEERSLADLQRNALVSVFLRILEYYEGILILTSNRVGTFDEAFKSRIKLTLHYNSFAKPDRRKVWRNFIKMMESNQEENVEYDDLHDNLDQLAEYKMNGREIRNAISTAKELAQFRKQSLSYEHLKHVIQIAFDFEKYLEETRGWTAEEWQKEQGIR